MKLNSKMTVAATIVILGAISIITIVLQSSTRSLSQDSELKEEIANYQEFSKSDLVEQFHKAIENRKVSLPKLMVDKVKHDHWQIYDLCYPIWSEIIEGRQDWEPNMVKSQIEKLPHLRACVNGFQGITPKIDGNCLEEEKNSPDCKQQFGIYIAAVITFYVDHILLIEDLSQVPIEFLIYKYVIAIHRYIPSFGPENLNYKKDLEHMEKLDSYYQYLSLIDNPDEPSSKLIFGPMKEAQLRNLSSIALYKKISRERWFDLIEEYERSFRLEKNGGIEGPDPVFLFMAKVYGYERFQEYERLDQVIHDYILKGNIGGWGYYFLSKRHARAEEELLAKKYAEKALASDPENYQFKSLMRSAVSKERTWPLIYSFSEYADRKGEGVFIVWDAKNPWKTWDEYQQEMEDNEVAGDTSN